MSEEFVPTVDMIRSAWRYAMTSEVEPDVDADSSFERFLVTFKQRQQAVGHTAAQEAMQATLDGSIRQVQAKAWDKGHAAGRDYQADGWNCDAHDPAEDNPYRSG